MLGTAGRLLLLTTGSASTSHASPMQAKADAEVRWAVLNVVTLLRRHEGVHDALAAAMQRGASVG